MRVDYVTPVSGFWLRVDVYRWEARGTSKGTGSFAGVPEGMGLHVGGWKPITESIRWGGPDIAPREPHTAHGDYEAEVRERPQAAEARTKPEAA